MSKPSLLDRIRGKRYDDINLPNSTGEIDPRLKGKSVREGFERAGHGAKMLKEKGILSGIDRAAKRK